MAGRIGASGKLILTRLVGVVKICKTGTMNAERLVRSPKSFHEMETLGFLMNRGLRNVPLLQRAAILYLIASVPGTSGME